MEEGGDANGLSIDANGKVDVSTSDTGVSYQLQSSGNNMIIVGNVVVGSTKYATYNDTATIINSVSGSISNGKLKITVNGVESGDIPLPQTDTFLPFTNVKDINQAPNGYLFTDRVLVCYDTYLEYSPDSFPWNGYDSINDLYNDIKKYDGKNYGINFNPGNAGIAPVSIKLNSSKTKIVVELEESSMYNVIILPLHSD